MSIGASLREPSHPSSIEANVSPGKKRGRRDEASFEQCPCTGAHLDKFIQPAVLAILAAGPQHGYALLDRLRALPMFEGHAPDSTGLYRMLGAMEERGLTRSRWDTSRRGPAKKLFELTGDGRECLSRWFRTLDDYRDRLGRTMRALRRLGPRPRRGP